MRSFRKNLSKQDLKFWTEHRRDTEACLSGHLGAFRAKYGYVPKAIWHKRRHELAHFDSLPS